MPSAPRLSRPVSWTAFSVVAAAAVTGFALTATPAATAATAPLVTPDGAPHLFLDSIGRATVAGAVRASAAVERVGVRVALRDKSGKVLTHLDIATLLRRVPRGGVAGYRFQTDGMSGTGYWPTAVRADVVAVSARPASGPVDQGYRVTVRPPVTALGIQEVDGTVSGHAGAQLLVALVFRDAAGHVVDAGTAFPVGGRRVGATGSAPFALRRYVDSGSRQPSWTTVVATAEGDGSGLVTTARVVPRPAAAGPRATTYPRSASRAEPVLAGAVTSTAATTVPVAPVGLAVLVLVAAGASVLVVRR